MPSTLNRFCREILPSILHETSGERLLETAAAVWETDRWNSFDRFHDTTQTLVQHYERAGAQVEVEPIQTGGWLDSGRWIIDQAQDVVAASVDIVHPVRQRVLDYQENPWHVVGWTSSTAREGIRTQLVVYDTVEELKRLKRGALNGKTVLTSLNPRDHLRLLADKGAAAVISDQPVPNLPDALQWIRFGWGEAPAFRAGARLVGLVVSQNQGRKLRKLLQRHATLTLETVVEAREYVGTHDVVSGIIRGTGDPDDEVWAIAHSAEPGAVDNASGVALCLEMSRVLEGLIASGSLPRPKRSIRLVNAYECYGFFAFLERKRPLRTPLAGVCLDTLGSKPEVCDGRMEWHATIPMSAGFVDWVGEKILRETLRRCNPGYRLCLERFMPTSDTLIGDPQYGFPCPWLDTHHRASGKGFDAYHTSADVLDLLSADGMRACATGMAAYLYFLADAGSRELVELANTDTQRTLRQLDVGRRKLTVGQAGYIRETHRVGNDRLKRWMWGGDRSEILAQLAACERQVADAADSATRAGSKRRVSAKARQVPRRVAFLSPQKAPVRSGPSGLTTWSLFWADGKRNLAEIAELASCEETGKIGGNKKGELSITAEQAVEYFQAHAKLGYVELTHPQDALSRARLVDDLRKLGLRAGMDVMVHSSLSAIGSVAGGAETVVDALLKAIGKTGTLMMPSFHHRAAPIYNAMATPTTNGAIPDAMWRRPEAVRSDHPTHAVAAIGPRAEEYCRDHLKAGIWAQDSPIGRLIHTGGYVLALGATHYTSTAYHVAEMSVPCSCIDPEGNVDRVVAPDGSVREVAGLAFRSEPCPVSVHKLDTTLDRRKLQRRGKVGEAEAEFVKAIDLWKVRREHLKHACPTCPVKPAYTSTSPRR
jgi:aminoglycoside 3-N-acetyltransferase